MSQIPTPMSVNKGSRLAPPGSMTKRSRDESLESEPSVDAKKPRNDPKAKSNGQMSKPSTRAFNSASNARVKVPLPSKPGTQRRQTTALNDRTNSAMSR